MLWRLTRLHAARVPHVRTRDILPFRIPSHRAISTLRAPLVTHAQLLNNGTSTPTEIEASNAQEIKVAGLVRSARWKKSMVFVHLHDGTTYEPLQAILPIDLASG